MAAFENQERPRRERKKLEPVGPAKPKAEQEPTSAGKKPRRRSGVIRRRWLVNTLSATVLIVVVAITSFTVAMYSY